MDAEYQKFQDYHGGGRSPSFAEKTLEHYLACKLLNISRDDVYIDIANSGSPVPETYHKLYGCKVYRQDLVFREGIDGNVIRGDAGSMPIQDGFATKLALYLKAMQPYIAQEVGEIGMVAFTMYLI